MRDSRLVAFRQFDYLKTSANTFFVKNIFINREIWAKPSDLGFHLRLPALMKNLNANHYG